MTVVPDSDRIPDYLKDYLLRPYFKHIKFYHVSIYFIRILVNTKVDSRPHGLELYATIHVTTLSD